MATIKDVAAAAGVSASTVSRVMNGSNAISRKVQARVRKAAEELGYQPNEMARSLQTRKTHIIGLVAFQADKPFFGRLIQSVERRCYENGYKLLLCTSGGDPDRENSFASMFDANKLDGAILAGWVDYDSDFASRKLPVVTVERRLSDAVPMVSCDNVEGGRIAARTLAERGCTHPVITSSVGAGEAPIQERLRGFAEECARLGLQCQTFPVPPYDVFLKEYVSYFETLFREHPEIDGFFGTDELAVTCWSACRELGIPVPGRVQIVGFDGLDISERFKVTTVAQPIEEMGTLAFDLLRRLMEGEVVATRSILPVRLIERETTRRL